MSRLADEGGPNVIDPSAIRRCSACGLPHKGGIEGHNFSADAPMDDLNACYGRPPIKWKTPLTWTDTLARDTLTDPPITNVPPALHESYRRVLEEAEEIWLDRQGQYGMTPFATKPAVLLSLVQVKLWRLEEDFGAEDGWLDLLNYAAIGLMVARGEWE